MKTPENLAEAYLRGWGHCHGGGQWCENPFHESEEAEYWSRGFKDCEGGVIDGPIALGMHYIEP